MGLPLPRTLALARSVRRCSHFAWLSHNAASRMSASLIVPFELEYMNRLHWMGWNSAAVMTSVNSSMLTGLMSTMSAKLAHAVHHHPLKLWSLMFKFHRLIRKSSADMYVSWSELTEIELMWYACALAYTLRGTAAVMESCVVMRGKRRGCDAPTAPPAGYPSEWLFSATTLICLSNTFHSLIVLSKGVSHLSMSLMRTICA